MDERMRILERIESGELDVEEGARRLEALDQPDRPSRQRPPVASWIWPVVFWSGLAFFLLGGLLLALVYGRGVGSGWLILGWPSLVTGVLVWMLGWWMRRSQWFFLRVRESNGSNFTLPLPIAPLAWGVRIARPFVPRWHGSGVDEVLEVIQAEMARGGDFVVDVDDREGTERVEVYFG